jgi:hypothetical protein
MMLLEPRPSLSGALCVISSRNDQPHPQPRPRLSPQHEDYDVLDNRKVVGRNLESGSRFDPPDALWTWSITSIWPSKRGVTNGTAATREQAMAKCGWARDQHAKT